MVIVNRHVEPSFPEETWDVEEETMTDLHFGRNGELCPHRQEDMLQILILNTCQGMVRKYGCTLRRKKVDEEWDEM